MTDQQGAQYLAARFESDSMVETMVHALVVHFDFDWDIGRTGEDYSNADLWEWAMEVADRYDSEDHA